MKKSLLFIVASVCCISLHAQMVIEFNTNLTDTTLVALPLFGTVDVTVNWGDGNIESYNSPGIKEHNYSVDNTYEVSITGSLDRFGKGEWGYPYAETISKVLSFGDLGLTSLSGAFRGASNLSQVPQQIPVSVTDVSYLFSDAELFNQDIGNWKVDSITNMCGMFQGATLFNQDISTWNVSKVENISLMFNDAIAFNQNISSWDVSNVTDMDWVFCGASSFNQPIGEWDVSNVVSMEKMFYHAEAFNQPIGDWDMSNVVSMKEMFAYTKSFNQYIGDWDLDSVANISRLFMGAESFNQPLENWDVSNVSNMSGTFSAALAFNQPLGNWDLSKVENISLMFHDAILFNHDISNWDVSNVTDMDWVFCGALSFNQPIGEWDVSSVTDMDLLFSRATSFNQDLGNWDVSSVVSMEKMFYHAEAFNQPIGEWDVSSVVSMEEMFAYAKSFNQYIGDWNLESVANMSGMFLDAKNFNQPLDNWNVSNVIDMSGIFAGAHAFNQPIGNWNVSKVTDMRYMFQFAYAFNQDIRNWNVSNVSDMHYMFYDAKSFNQDIDEWNVSNVKDLSSMFSGASVFNQYIGNWDVSSATNMSQMFRYAYAFNQDLSTWITNEVTDMSGMFQQASAFNQDIGMWHVSNVTDMNQMFQGVELSTAFYNSILTGWSAQDLQPNVNFHAGTSKYSPGIPEAAKQVLTDEYNWIIEDGGISELPAVYTFPISDITPETASSGGEVTENGGYEVSARGIVWNTESDPTLDTNTGSTNEGSEISAFTSSISSLNIGTTYFVRAYATNTQGTEYGNQYQFTATKELSLGGSFNVTDKIYDGTKNAEIVDAALTPEGILLDYPGVTIINPVVQYDNADAGNEIPTSIISAQIGGADSSKYRLSLIDAPTSQASILPKELSITGYFTGLDKAYDGAVSAVINEDNLSLSGIVASDSVLLTNTVIVFTQADVGENISLSIIDAELEGPDTSNYSLTINGAPTANANITPKTLKITGTFTVFDKEYDGTITAQIDLNNLQLDSIIEPEEVLLKNIAVAFNQAEAGTNIPVSIIDADLDGPDTNNYALSIEDAPTTTGAIFISETGLDDKTTSNITVFPNPAKNYVNITSSLKIEKLLIYTFSGAEVYSKLICENNTQFSISNLEPGVYMIHLFTEAGILTRKLQISR